MFRCALRRSPSSSLANECITAMAEGLNSSFFGYFLSLIWRDSDSTYLSEADSSVDSEWDSFCSILKQLCGSSVNSPRLSNTKPSSSWDFLINSKFHKNFCKHNFINGASFVKSCGAQDIPSLKTIWNNTHKSETSSHIELVKETLNCLHAVYESLKLDTLRRRYTLFPCLYFSVHLKAFSTGP